MWSKQADVRNTSNMTSFKNKITNRKQKSSTIIPNSLLNSNDNNSNNLKSESVEDKTINNKKSKNNKRRNRGNATGNTNKKSIPPSPTTKSVSNDKNKDTNILLKSYENIIDKNDDNKTNLELNITDSDDIISLEDNLELTDVVLRTNVDSCCTSNSNVIEENIKNINNLKRYSDSFVNKSSGNKTVKETTEILLTVNDKTKKSRRFSDLFRHGGLKSSNSIENINNKSKMVSNEVDSTDSTNRIIQTKILNCQKSGKNLTNLSKKELENNKNKTGASNNKIVAGKNLNRNDSFKVPLSNEVPKKGKSMTIDKKHQNNCNTNNKSNIEIGDSYLQRVKSKIYNKTKTTTNNNCRKISNEILPSKVNIKIDNKNRIPENETVDSQFNFRKSLTHFDFRLLRQTSNLERIRSKTFGSSTKSVLNNVTNDNNTTNNNENTVKPILVKAKSSSAINLNLLRTRRNRLLEQIKKRNGKEQDNVTNEFDFYSFSDSTQRLFGDNFGGSQRLATLQDNVVYESQISLVTDDSSLGDNKPSQPVSRSGSDRRHDVVREESKSQDNSLTSEHGHHDKPENDVSTPESTTSFPSAGSNKKKASSNINRSESVKEQSEKRKQRRNISDPSHNTTGGDVELDHQPPGLSNTDSGSSSNSSISYNNGRLSESPSNSVDVVTSLSNNRKKSGSDWESDTDMEPANWQKLFPEEELRNLLPHEKKRQDVINELFHTESTHVRNLRVLHDIFYKTLAESQVLKSDELSLIFPNIKEVLNVHIQFNREMKRKRREDRLVGELGDMIVNMFGGVNGASLQEASATFCQKQQVALEFIKERRKRDSKFDAILSECEKKRQCRRLPLQGIVPTEMQRLSKYPLLLERLISSMEIDILDEHGLEELEKLRRAHHLSKEILNNVNEAAKLALNEVRLEEIQRHLDTTNFERSDQPIAQEFKTIDLTKHKLIVEGNMQLRRPNKGIVPVHILLLEEAVIILHKEGDKYLLKFFQSGSSAQPAPLSPIIKMSSLLVRTNAVCKNALFLVSCRTNQMYDLLAEDDARRDVWFKHFSDAADACNKKEGKNRGGHEPPSDSYESETVQELPSTPRDIVERVETVGGSDDNAPFDGEDEAEQRFSDAQDEGKSTTETKETAAASTTPATSSDSGGGKVKLKVSVEEWPLIQPSQVHVAVPPIHTAESRLTQLEQIRRKDEEVRRALEDKESLVADLLSIPREHFHVIADIAGDVQDLNSPKDLSERIVASIYQVDQLHLAVNEAFNLTESTTIVATGGKHLSCNSQEHVSSHNPPCLDAHRVKVIANSLSAQLTTILDVVKSFEDEKVKLKKEINRLNEKLHEQASLHGPEEQSNSPSPPPSPPPPESQQDLESIQESPTELES